MAYVVLGDTDRPEGVAFAGPDGMEVLRITWQHRRWKGYERQKLWRAIDEYVQGVATEVDERHLVNGVVKALS
jgi:hypothetical protein